jgi:hypothetical protein
MSEEVTVNINVKGADKGAKDIDKLGNATKKVKKETKEMETGVMAAWGEVNILGTSLGSVGKAFTSTAKTAKLMFSSIKIGLISTGIGAFVVAIGSLATYFTSTQKGAEKLEIAMAKLGATFQVIKDRASSFGEGLLKIFKKGGLKEGVEQMKNSFKGVGDEIKEDVKLMGELAQASIDLRQAERAINQETARRRAEIEQLKLVAEDVTKTEEERLAAAEKAFSIEKRLVNQRVANAREAVRIQKEEMEASENMEADLEKLTQLEINLANIQQESTTKQIELNNKINAIRKEGEAKKEQARIKEQQDKEKADKQIATDLEVLRQANATEQENELFQAQQKYEKLIALANKYGQDTSHLTKVYGEQVKAINKKYNEDEVKDEELTQQAKMGIVNNSLSALTGALGENSKIGKGIAVAQALMNTYQGITLALASSPPPFNMIAAAAAGLTGFKAVKDIMKTDPTNPSPDTSGGVDGGGDTPAPVGGIGANLIPTQLMEEVTEPAQQPVQAFVVETEISDSQALQEELDLQTTI